MQEEYKRKTPFHFLVKRSFELSGFVSASQD